MLEQLHRILISFSGFSPEAGLVFAFAGLILADLVIPESDSKSDLFHLLTCIAFVLIGMLVYRQWQYQPFGFLFDQMLLLDGKSLFFKSLILLTAFIAILHSWVTKRRWAGEFFALLTGMTLGLFLLTMATNLLMIYLSVEVVSLSSYILTAFRKTRRSAEASVKYVLFGSVASALMLYGMSLTYGITTTLDFINPAFSRALVEVDPLVSGSVLLLTLSGLLFKISAVPFQIWNPDVYEGADTPVVSFFSVAPKAAAFLTLIRLLSVAPVDFQPVLAVISLATIVIGNFSALWQTDAKRLMAYSSIAQSGFVLIGLVAFSEVGLQASIFYLASYLFATMGGFLLIDLFVPTSEATPISRFNGLGRIQPIPGILMTLVMISLVGLPLTVGFSAKLFVFSGLWEIYQQTSSGLYAILLVFGLLNTAVSLAFYLKIPFALFFRDEQQPIQSPGWLVILIASLVVFPVVILFFRTDWLMNWISSL
ncbi:MAG: NADH-quinone oxidoreductase subunit N [Siphonobacter sp.]